MFLLRHLDQVVGTLSLESVLVGTSSVECNGCEGSLFMFLLWRRRCSSLLSPDDSRPAGLSNSAMEVVFIPPVIILSPAFGVQVSFCSR